MCRFNLQSRKQKGIRIPVSPHNDNKKLIYILEIKNIKTIFSTTTFYFPLKYVF